MPPATRGGVPSREWTSWDERASRVTPRRAPSRGATAGPHRPRAGHRRPVQPGPTEPAAAAPQRSRPRFTGRAAVLGLVLLVLVISYASSLRAWLQQRAEIAAAQADIVQTQAAVDALGQAKLRWNDPDYVQAQARERFGWVLPGEVGYRVIDPDGDPLGAAAQLASLPPVSDQTGEDWYETVWQSIESAGTPEPDPAAKPTDSDGPNVIKPPKGHRSQRQ